MERASNTSTSSADLAPAVLWEPAEGGAVRCNLCAHRCKVAEGKEGVCRVRVNRGGRLYTLVANRIVAGCSDPIEKKPLFHFLPGSSSFSVATPGCNFKCSYCQNWQISQFSKGASVEIGPEVPPADVIRLAESEGCSSISFTYTEPTIFFETCLEVGELARSRGLRNVFVTNGYMTPAAVEASSGFLDAANVDLKGFSDATYRRVCGASLQGVLDGLTALVRAGVWVEVTTLVVPGLNDSEEELRDIARFLSSLSQDLPWHISRFHPDYKMRDTGPTPLAALRRALGIGREEGLRFVYLGNVPGDPSEDTRCPNCGELLIARSGFRLTAMRLRDGLCPGCLKKVAGVFSTSQHLDPPVRTVRLGIG